MLRNKAGGRLGFAMMLKYLLWRGRFPRGRHEIPDDAIAHVARQIGVSAGDMGFYDVASRQARNHRAEIRGHTGFRVCTVADADKLALWLAGGVARDGRSADHVRAELLCHCKAERIEPPTTDRVKRIVESGIRQADGVLVEMVVSRLSGQHIARIEALVGIDVVNGQAPDADADADEDEDEPDPDVLASIKTDPGNVSLASMLTEITKLEAVRAIGLPATLFTDIGPKVVTTWRARAAVESPSHLRRHAQPVRLALLAALLYQRQREITDTLVELLNACVHKINAHAEKKVTEEFVRQYKRIRNKDAMLQRVAEVSLESPAEPVRKVIYPVMGGEAGLTELVREYRARRAYERDKRRVFKSSYTNHYRTGLIKLLQVLEFRSNNTEHQPGARRAEADPALRRVLRAELAAQPGPAVRVRRVRRPSRPATARPVKSFGLEPQDRAARVYRHRDMIDSSSNDDVNHTLSAGEPGKRCRCEPSCRRCFVPALSPRTLVARCGPTRHPNRFVRWAGRSSSARSTPGPATGANSRSPRPSVRSTTRSGSGSAWWHPRVTPTGFWSRDRSPRTWPVPCARRWRRCLSPDT